MTEGRRSRDARLLLTGIAADAFGTGLTLPFLVVYLHAVRGIGLETVGLIVAVPAAVALFLLAPIGVLVDHFGPRRIQMGALVAAASGALLLSRAETAPAAFVARMLTGIGAAAFWPANDALVASVVPSEIRQRYFGVSFALLNAGIGVGGIIGALFVDVGRAETFATVYRVDALTFVVPLVLLAFPLRHVGGPISGPAAAVHAPGSYGAVVRDGAFRRLLLLSFVSSFVGYGQVEGGWTAYANVIARVSARTLGIAFAVNTTVIVVLQVVVLRLIDGRRRTRMLMLQAALWGCSWAILGTAGRVPGTPLAAVLVVGAFGVFAVGETLLSPTLPAIRNDVAPAALRGRYNAAAGIAFQLAHISGPSVAGVLLGAGRGNLFIAMLVGGCALLALVTRRLEQVLPPRANGVGVAPPAHAASDDGGGTRRRAQQSRPR
jgi:MFS family permease